MITSISYLKTRDKRERLGPVGKGKFIPIASGEPDGEIFDWYITRNSSFSNVLAQTLRQIILDQILRPSTTDN
jgi:hypothetical protein